MDNVIQNIKDNPALVVALVSAIAAVAIAFGVALTAEQVGVILALVNAVLAIVLGKPVAAVRKAKADREARRH